MNLPTVSEAALPDRATEQAEEVVRLEGVTVRYRAPSERIDKFKEYAIRLLQGKLRHKHFLALQDVSLSLQRGEVCGVIGHNGAGKSTLLKLVSRVLRPTRGRVWVRGRVAPLLEVGAGFHPELTGRENIYLNGAILGFTRKEMARKFDRIVDFAELGDFIDAPMRTYSTGMWARLGFAVAIDVEPDILIVDEVLSVGDQAFQRKCLDRIQEFRARGITILLVSHNIEMIEIMCHRAAWLDHGRLVVVGPAESVARQYREHSAGAEAARLAAPRELKDILRGGTHKIEIVQVRLMDDAGYDKTIFQTGQTLRVEMEYLAHEPVPDPVFGMAIFRQDGTHITGPNTGFDEVQLPTLAGRGKITYAAQLPILEGLYEISVSVHNRADTETYDFHDRSYKFRMVNQWGGTSERYGMITLKGDWQHEEFI
jgi:lipopolysaccharide transport system ATP-binding protein